MLKLGPHLTVDPPVVLAPLAGITNVAFRRLCREYGAGLYISEMITSRALVEGNPKTRQLITFAADESPRSIQLYGVDPSIVGQAVRIIVEQDLADHVDLNFGCPVPKVTRRGGGSALPWRINLFSDLVSAAVRAADGQVPVSVKMRLGIDRDHLTYTEAALRAQEAGVAYVALHGRTAVDFYGGQADWAPIAELSALLDIPVLGNGDIWEAADALRMVAETGCAGVVVGRGCLGRPWLFRDLADAFAGRETQTLPRLGEVVAVMRRHDELLSDLMGEEKVCTEFRKHVAWYLKGFRAGGDLRHRLALVDSLATLDDLLGKLDPSEAFPTTELGSPRGRQGSSRRVALPDGWLLGRDDLAVDPAAEIGVSGG